MRILVIRFSSLGDVILALGVVRGLACGAGRHEVHFLTKPAYHPLLECLDFPLRVVPADPRRLVSSVWRTLRPVRFDGIVDLHGSLRSRLLSRLLRARQRVAVVKNTKRRRDMVRYKTGLDNPISTLKTAAAAIACLDVSLDDCTPYLCLTDEEQTRSDALRKDHRPCLAIGWGARWPTKIVPSDFWSRLLDAMGREWTGRLRIFGLESDRAAIDNFIGEHRQRHAGVLFESVCGLALRDVMVRLHSCNLFVGSDSGLMHLAGALGLPAFGLFGPTHPALGFAPAGPHSRAFHAGIWCSPCHRHGAAPCFRGRRHCFDELDPGAVAAGIHTILETKGLPDNADT